MTTTGVTTEFIEELTELLGPANVSVELSDREQASADWAKLSPILAAQLPLGLADVVATPTSAADIGATVALAARHRVYVTPRGKGTGNYGQAIPMSGGLVLDTSLANRVLELADGQLTAESGATLASLEAAAQADDQQIWMFPSTVNSSVGGFLAGGTGGTGSIVHGTVYDGFVVSLDMAYADGDACLHHITGDEMLPHLHAYGCSGLIAAATIRTEPLQDWRALYTSFDRFEDCHPVLRRLAEVDPKPRLVSADTVTVSEALPRNPAIPHGRASLRAIVDVRSVPEATDVVERAGGRVEDVREGSRACNRLSLHSYNHPTWYLQRSRPPNTVFHLEVWGDALVDRFPEVDAVYEGSELHLEAGFNRVQGMLNGRFRSTEQVYAGIERLGELGVGVHDPHQWLVDRNVDEVKALSRTADPFGILNPGKLV